MKRILFAGLGALAIMAGAGSGEAQIGGAGVVRSTAATLGYLQFFTPPPLNNQLSDTQLCKGWPVPSFTQQTGLVGGYAILYDASGKPHYVPGC
jgi:hypothetical protein